MLPYFCLLISFLAAGQPEQAKPAPGISLEESRRISPFPPTAVRTTRNKGRVVVEWRPVPLARIVSYEVFRSVDGGSFEVIGNVVTPPFVDKSPPKGNLVYGVSSVDNFDNRSKLQRETKP